MATLAGISSLIPHIYQAVFDYAKESLFMPNLVTVLTDEQGWQSRGFYEYSSSGTVWRSVAEATDVTAQTFNPSSLGTLSVGEVAYRIDLYDRRMSTDGNLGIDVMADIAREINYKVMKAPEVDLISQFSVFTAGTVWAGSAANTAGTLNWGNLYAARAILEKANIPGPYYAVIDQYQYHYLATAANIAGLSNAAPLQIRNDIQRNYLQQQIGNDFYLYVTPNLGTNSSAQQFAGVFTRPALVLDVRKGLNIELERDASKRLTELVSTMWYGYGAVRTGYGVTIRGTVLSAPNN